MKLDEVIEIEIGLYADAMTPSIKGLMLEQDGGGYRITASKGCGSWNLERKFKCSFPLTELKAAMRQKLRSRK